jgi:hypothetical protein
LLYVKRNSRKRTARDNPEQLLQERDRWSMVGIRICKNVSIENATS